MRATTTPTPRALFVSVFHAVFMPPAYAEGASA